MKQGLEDRDIRPPYPITMHAPEAAVRSSEQESDMVRSELGEIPLVLSEG